MNSKQMVDLEGELIYSNIEYSVACDLGDDVDGDIDIDGTDFSIQVTNEQYLLYSVSSAVLRYLAESKSPEGVVVALKNHIILFKKAA